MRKRYIQDPRTHKLIPAEEYRRPHSPSAPEVLPDIEPFVSPVDRTVVSSRSHLREHNRRHGVAQLGEYGPDDGREHFARAERERQMRLQGQTREQRRERLETIIPLVLAHEK